MADVRLRRAYIELNARVGRYESALNQARRDNARFESSLRNMRQQMTRTNTGFGVLSRSAGTFRTAIVGLAAGFSIRRIASSIQEAASYGATLVETARGIGITTDELERLRFAFQSDGVAQGQADKLLRQLLRTYDEAREGVKEYRDEYERLGFTQKDFESGQINVIDLIERVNQGLLTLQDTAAQTNVLQNIAGRSGPVALAAFQAGRIADIARSEELRTTLDPARLKEIDQQILNMSQSWDVFRNSLVSTFSPQILEGLGFLTNLSRSVGAVFENTIPTLDAIDRLGQRQVNNLSEAEAKLAEIERVSEVVRQRLSTALSPDAEFSEIAAIEGLENRLIELAVLYGQTENAVKSFREEQDKNAESQRRQAQAAEAYRNDFTAINALIAETNTSLRSLDGTELRLNFNLPLREIQQLNTFIQNPPDLTGLFNLTEARRGIDRTKTSLDFFLESLSQTSSLQRELESRRLDLRLERGEVTIEQYERLRIELDAIQDLQSQGIPVDERTDNILKQRIDLMTDIRKINDEINDSQGKTNDLLDAARFASKRFSEGMLDVAFQSRSVRGLIAAIGVELAKAAVRTNILNPFTNLLSGFFGGQNPIRRQYGGTFFAGRNAYVINETGAERLTQTRVLSSSQTQNIFNRNQPQINLTVNAIDVAGVEQAIERATPRIVEIAGQYGRFLADEDQLRESL